MSGTILFGDCRASLHQMAAAGVKVQMCVTSPPYYGLRDYGHDGQIGLEETPEQYIAHLVEVFRAVREVLADDGTLWVNIGDSYAQAGGRGEQGATSARRGRSNVAAQEKRQSMKPPMGCKPKDLIGIPWMLAFALRADGWHLRQDIIWHKPNPMPESVTDRCTKAHEYLFLLSKGPRYFYDHEAVKEEAVGNPSGNKERRARPDAEALRELGFQRGAQAGYIPWLGDEKRNRRSVWKIATKPYAGAHFAVFPRELVEPCIEAGTSERGHCPQCGARWTRVVRTQRTLQGGSARAGRSLDEINASGKHLNGGSSGNRTLKGGPVLASTTLGWQPGCACGTEPVPDVVLDPFMGSGTTAEAAILLGRGYAGCELNENYKALQDARIAAARTAVATPPLLEDIDVRQMTIFDTATSEECP
jgi:DNA modification methylase